MSGDKSVTIRPSSTGTSTDTDTHRPPPDPLTRCRSMSVAINNENAKRPRKRFSYPLISSYETELPGIRRLPLSPIKPAKQARLDSSASTARPTVIRPTPNILLNKFRTKNKSVEGNTTATKSLLDSVSQGIDIYDPANSVDTFSASCFTVQRNRILRRLQHSDGNDFFSILPDEMVLKIFNFLPKTALFNCATVSRRFHDLGTDETMWKRIDAIGRFLCSESVTVIFSRNPVYLRFARSLVTCPNGLSEDFLAPQLHYLDLSMAQITAPVLARILSMCTSLRKLSLEALACTREVIQGMMASRSTIDTLNLTMCYDVNFEGLLNFLANCPSLNALNLGCIKQDWTRDELLIIINVLPAGIERLNLAGFVHQMMNEHVQVLVSRLCRLKELDLSDSQEITEKSVQYIVKGLQRLESLGLSRCYNIPVGVYNILSSAPKLTSVQLFAIFKEPTMAGIRTALPQIKFNLEPCSTIARPTVGNKRSSIWGERVRD